MNIMPVSLAHLLSHFLTGLYHQSLPVWGLMKSLLLVDDEPVVSVELQKALQKSRYHVELAEDVETAQHMVETTHFDLMIVDLNLKAERKGLPNPENGTGLVRELRAAGINIPILMHSALSGDYHEMAALDAGADEYIVKKSYSFRVLLSRIQAHFRRDERLLGTKPSATRFVGTNHFKLDREERRLSVGHKSLELTVREMKVMDMFAASPTKVFTCDEILTKVWGHDVRRSPTALESVLHRLRQKFQEHKVQDLIENVRGKGYRLAVTSVAHSQ
jgi:DNA-binding response OmpR family regulator